MTKRYIFSLLIIFIFWAAAFTQTQQRPQKYVFSTKDDLFSPPQQSHSGIYLNKAISYDSQLGQVKLQDWAAQPAQNSKVKRTRAKNRQNGLIFSAVFEEIAGGHQWNFNLPWEDFDPVIDTLANAGFRIESVSTYGSDENLYSSTWVQDSSRWALALNLDTVDKFMNFLNDISAETNTFKLIDFAIYPFQDNLQLYGAVAVEESEMPVFSWIFNADLENFESWVTEKYEAGVVLTEVEVYGLPGTQEARYAAIAEPGDFVQQIHWLQSMEEFLTANDEMANQGMVLKDISTYRVGSDIVYAGLWNTGESLYGWSVGFTSRNDFLTAISGHESNNLRPIEFAILDTGDPTVSVEAEAEFLPQTIQLAQNYPNPFNPETTISYTLPAAGLVKLEIYDVTGRKIKTLISERQSAGAHKVKWQGEDTSGAKVASGVYYYELTSGELTLSNKMLLLK